MGKLMGRCYSLRKSTSNSIRCSRTKTSASGGSAPLAALRPLALAARDDIAHVATESGGAAAGRFAWVDGVLVRAMEQGACFFMLRARVLVLPREMRHRLCSGAWLVLDNVNLCASSVLDRMNPLLEVRDIP